MHRAEDRQDGLGRTAQRPGHKKNFMVFYTAGRWTNLCAQPIRWRLCDAGEPEFRRARHELSDRTHRRFPGCIQRPTVHAHEQKPVVFCGDALSLNDVFSSGLNSVCSSPRQLVIRGSQICPAEAERDTNMPCTTSWSVSQETCPDVGAKRRSRCLLWGYIGVVYRGLSCGSLLSVIPAEAGIHKIGENKWFWGFSLSYFEVEFENIEKHMTMMKEWMYCTSIFR